jgi:hypothetical protein
VSESVALDKLTAADFTRHIDTTFGLLTDSGSVPIILTSVTNAPIEMPGRRQFSLIFLSPRDLVLPQRIYALRHDVLGVLEIFLVPILPTAENCRYEAVFN